MLCSLLCSKRLNGTMFKKLTLFTHFYCLRVLHLKFKRQKRSKLSAKNHPKFFVQSLSSEYYKSENFRSYSIMYFGMCCLLGTFLCNNEGERQAAKLKTKTISLWLVV